METLRGFAQEQSQKALAFYFLSPRSDYRPAVPMGITDADQDQAVTSERSFCRNYPEEYKLLREIILDW